MNAPIVFNEITYHGDAKSIEIECRVSGQTLHYKVSSDYVRDLLPLHPEFALIAVMPKAMQDGWDIYLNSPVDPVFLSNLEHYQDRMIAPPEDTADEWVGILPEGQVYPEGYDKFVREYKSKLHKVKITAPLAKIVGPNDKWRVGTMVSGGVDSTYTLLGVKELTDAIHIENMNWPNSDATLRLLNLLRPDLRLHRVRVADFYHKQDSEHWIFFGHGSFLASAALLFSQYLTCMVTSGTDRAPGIDMGSGHDIDYLWSSSHMRFYSYGNVPRFKKIEFLGNHPQSETILKYLHICSDAPKRADKTNCSRCWKCVYTMLLLDANGLRDRATAFDYTHFVEDFLKYPMANDYSVLLNMPMILQGYKKTGNTQMLTICEEYVARAKVSLKKLERCGYTA